MNLEDVYNAYREHYHIGNTQKIDVQLATALSRDMKDKPIWLLNVGPSGIGKTMLTDPLIHIKNDHEPITRKVSQLTPNSIVSGQPGEQADLAPQLDKKIFYIPDFSTVVGLHSDAQRKIFSQFRDLYDGYARKDTGTMLEDPEYDVHVTFIGNVTNAIYNQSLIHQQMGTRFIFYRFTDYDEEKVEERVLYTEQDGADEEIGEAIQDFFNYRTMEPGEFPITQDMGEEIIKIARWMAKMRASGEFDGYHKELTVMPHPEKPTRIIKQFKKLVKCLKVLDDDYSDERVLRILKQIAVSSADPLKVTIYKFIKTADSGVSESDIINYLQTSQSAAKKRIQEMWHVGIIEENKMSGDWSAADSFDHIDLSGFDL